MGAPSQHTGLLPANSGYGIDIPMEDQSVTARRPPIESAYQSDAAKDWLPEQMKTLATSANLSRDNLAHASSRGDLPSMTRDSFPTIAASDISTPQ